MTIPRPIGLLGGTAWTSTIDYYQKLNLLAARKFGADHSAEIQLRSIDYYRLKKFYPHRWDEVANELLIVLKELDQTNPACIVICNNTLHKALDLIPYKTELRAPVVHIVNSAIELLRKHEVKKPLFLATKFTMEDDFYKSRLLKEGFDVTVPEQEIREQIHLIQTQLSTGADPKTFGGVFSALCGRYVECDSILLACTELPLVFKHMELGRPVLDPSIQQLEVAFEYFCGERR